MCASWLVTQESERSGTRLQWSFDILYLDLPTFRPTYVQAYHLLPEELKGIPLRDWNAPCFLKFGVSLGARTGQFSMSRCSLR